MCIFKLQSSCFWRGSWRHNKITLKIKRKAPFLKGEKGGVTKDTKKVHLFLIKARIFYTITSSFDYIMLRGNTYVNASYLSRSKEVVSMQRVKTTIWVMKLLLQT